MPVLDHETPPEPAKRGIFLHGMTLSFLHDPYILVRAILAVFLHFAANRTTRNKIGKYEQHNMLCFRDVCTQIRQLVKSSGKCVEKTK